MHEIFSIKRYHLMQKITRAEFVDKFSFNLTVEVVRHFKRHNGKFQSNFDD